MKFIWIKGDRVAAFKDALAVRDQVFTQEQGFPAEIDYDAMDCQSWHLLLYRMREKEGVDASKIEHDLKLEARQS